MLLEQKRGAEIWGYVGRKTGKKGQKLRETDRDRETETETKRQREVEGESRESQRWTEKGMNMDRWMGKEQKRGKELDSHREEIR